MVVVVLGGGNPKKSMPLFARINIRFLKWLQQANSTAFLGTLEANMKNELRGEEGLRAARVVPLDFSSWLRARSARLLRRAPERSEGARRLTRRG